MNILVKLSKDLAENRGRQAVINKDLKLLKEAEEQLEAKLIEELVANEMKSTGKINGVGEFRIQQSVKISLNKANEESGFDFLRENDFGSLIKYSVNSMTLNAAMREFCRDSDGNMNDVRTQLLKDSGFNVYDEVKLYFSKE